MTRPPRLVGICYPDTIFGRNLPLGDLPTVHCRLRVLRPPLHRSRSVEQHRGDIAHIVAEGIVARLDLRLWDNTSEAECHSGGRSLGLASAPRLRRPVSAWRIVDVRVGTVDTHGSSKRDATLG